MTQAEKAALRDDMEGSTDALARKLDRMAEDSDVSPRHIAILRTKVEELKAFANHAIDSAPETN